MKNIADSTPSITSFLDRGQETQRLQKSNDSKYDIPRK